MYIFCPTKLASSLEIAVLFKYVKKLCLFLLVIYLKEYMVLSMKMGNGKVGRIEN
jgi:hypothetical protein